MLFTRQVWTKAINEDIEQSATDDYNIASFSLRNQ